MIYDQLKMRAHEQAISRISEKLSIYKEFPKKQTGFEQTINSISVDHFQTIDPWTELTDMLMHKNLKIDKSLIYSETITELMDQYFFSAEIPALQGEPIFRRSLKVPGYVARWQSYFLEDILRNSSLISQWDEFSIIQRNLFLSTCLIVDTGIHVYGWTIGESKEFIEKMTGLPDGSSQIIVERIVQNPGQMTIYAIGNHQMQNLVGQLQTRLNEKYVPKEFNDWLIGKGEMPFSIMEAQVRAYILMYEKMDQNNIQP